MNIKEYAIMFRVEQDHWWYKGLRAVFMQYWRKHAAELPASFAVLDDGCGTGALLHWFDTAHPQCALGIDFSQSAIAFCRQRSLERTVVASGIALPLSGESFDAVVSFDVLYHRAVTDKAAYLSEARRVLKPGGLLYLNTPAYQWLYSSHDVAVHTDWRSTRGALDALLARSGFEIVESTYWNTLLFPAMALVRLARRAFPPEVSDLEGKPGALPALSHTVFSGILAVERFLLRLAPLPFGLSIFAVARKK